jgi:hypothetical protein
VQASESEFPRSERFEMLARLGTGGMGVVFRARDRVRDTEVALKTLRVLSPDAILRFKNEFRALQDLQHRNLVSLGELYGEAGQWYFTMELVDGVDLLEWVRPTTAAPTDDRGDAPPPRPPLDEARLRDALAQLADGLCALHDAGKVHRDIKPSNILVTVEGRLVLLDFGLTTEVGAQPWSDVHVVGTADYMAPEQAASRPVGPAADWYAMGVVLYEALTGAVPFSGAPLEVLMQKQRDEPRPPSALAPGVPADLDALCRALLRTDPRARPDGGEVLQRLGGRAPAPRPAPSSLFDGFVGRRRELEQLGEALAASRGGCAVAVLVDGESGVGKSALVRRFTDEAQAAEQAVILAGRCHERESVPYKALDGVIDALSRHLVRLSKVEAASLLPRWAGPLAQVFPVLRGVEALSQAPLAPASVDPRELRVRVFAALRELLARLGERQPLVVVVDDLQWADADSLALLAELLHPPDAPSLLLVATLRSDAPPPELGVEPQRLQLPRLPSDEARELAARLLVRAAGQASRASAAAIADEAAGHPLFIDELVRHAVASDGEDAHGAPSPSIDETLWGRILRLDAPERELVELASVVGRPCPQAAAARALGVDPGELERRAARLRVAHLLRAGGLRGADAVEPYHDRVRAAVLAHLSVEARRAWHQRLARALEALGAEDFEALCAHWQEAGDRERAAHYAARAADRAAEALAFDRAARLYRTALELRPRALGRSAVRDPALAEARRLRQRLGDALAHAGRAADAAQAYLEATLGAHAGEALELRRRAAEQLLRSGHVDEGLAAVRTVLDAVGLRLAETPTGALAGFLARRAQIRVRGLGFREVDESQVTPAELTLIDTCWSVATGLAMVDTIRGADFQTRHLLLALRAGEPYRVARALAMEAAYSAIDGGRSWKRTEELLEAATRLAARIDHPHAIGLATTVAGSASFLVGRWRDAVRQCGAATEIFRDECRGATWELHTAQHFVLLGLTMLGELGELQRRVPELRRAARERGDRWMSAALRTSLVHLASLAADEPARARQEIAEALEPWSQRGFHLQHYWEMLAGAQTDLYVGDGPTALVRLTGPWRAVERSLVLRVQMVLIEALSLRARCGLAAASRLPPGSERRRLLDAVERDARRIAVERMKWAIPIAELLRAGLAAARGESERAVERLTAAAAGFDAVEMKLHAACARRRLAQLVGGSEGAALRAGADGWLASQAVRNPQRMADLIAPGF